MLRRFVFIYLALISSAFPEIISLSEAEKIGLKNRIDIVEKQINSTVATNNQISAIRSFFPEVSVNYGRNRSIVQRDEDYQEYQIGVNISQPVFDGLVLYEQEAIAGLNKKISKLDLIEIRRTLRLEIRQAFFEVQKSLDTLDVIDYRLVSARDLLENSIQEEKNGVISKLDLMDVANQFESSKLEKERALLSYKQALQNLEMVIRLPSNSLSGIKKFEIIIKLEKNNVQKMLAGDELVYKSPEVKRAKLNFLLSQKNKLISDTRWIPQISLDAHIGRTGKTWPPTEKEWGLGFRVSFSHFGSSISGGSNYSESKDGYSKTADTNMSLDIYNNPGWQNEILENDLKYLKSVDAYKISKQKVENLILNSIQEFRMDQNELELKETNLKISRHRYSIGKKQYFLGELTLNELMDIEAKVKETSIDIINSRFSLISKINQLEIDLGLEADDLDLFHLNEAKSPGE